MKTLNSANRDKTIPPEIIDLFSKENHKIEKSKEWNSLMKSYRRLYDTVTVIPFDWRFNAIHWALDVGKLCREIAYGLSWMKAYAGIYKSKVSPDMLPQHTDLHVSYFADNCITRIDSCRDKIALMAWAYYCAFDPEKIVLTFEEVMERLKGQVKFGLKLKRIEPFLKCLDSLTGDQFKRIEKYRHFKIHKREPRIELYGVKPHQDWPYMFPLDPKDIKRWQRNLQTQYRNQTPGELKYTEDHCRIDGVLFDRRNVKDRLWDYEDIKTCMEACF